MPESSYIVKPTASWLDDFLIWMSLAFGCCSKFVTGNLVRINSLLVGLGSRTS